MIGYGSMGHVVEARAVVEGHGIATVVNEHHTHLRAERLSESLRAADVAIDFSAAEAVRRNVEACLAAGVPLVEGTTGWLDERDEIERMVTDAGGAMIFGANFSIGVNLYFRVVEYAARLFSKFPEYEPFIEEQHHSQKKDAPSGTALKLKELVGRHIESGFTVTSTRAGRIPGTHRVGFDGPAEQILIEHTARNREGFATGAIMAAGWILGKKGFFEFTEVMDEISKSTLSGR